jgi:hypothetical protein
MARGYGSTVLTQACRIFFGLGRPDYLFGSATRKGDRQQNVACAVCLRRNSTLDMISLIHTERTSTYLALKTLVAVLVYHSATFVSLLNGTVALI